VSSRAAVAMRRYPIPTLIIFAVALALRLAYLVGESKLPTFGYHTMDPAYHHEWALSILEGQAPGGPFYRAPLYPYFLALVYGILGTGPWAILVIQALIGSLSCVIAFGIATSVFGRLTGLLAGLFLALYWPLVYFSGLLLVETLAIFLYLCALWVLTLSSARRKVGTALVYLAGCAVPVIPVTAHNVVAGRDAVVIAWHDGINLYIGNNPDADGVSAIAPEMRSDWWGGYHDAYRAAEEAAGRSLRPSEVARHWRSEAFRFIFGRPRDAATLFLRKAGYLLSATERSNNFPIAFFRGQSGLLSMPWLGYGFLLPVAAYGAWRERRRWRRLHVLYGFLITYAFGTLLFFVNARFRLPLTPIMEVFGAAGCVHVISLARRRRTREILTAGALIALVAAASQLVARGVARDLHTAQGHLIIGKALLERGEPRSAIEAFERATAAYPDIAGGFSDRGAAHVALGDTARAIEAYRREVERFPNDDRALFSLAQLTAARGDTVQAFTLYARALAAKPIPGDASDILYNVGNLHLGKGDLDRAERAYREALEEGPSNARAMNNLGTLYLRRRSPEEAERFFRRATGASPDYAGAHLNLGMAMMLQGKRAEARDAFRRALEIDPSLDVARRLIGDSSPGDD
jgi:tetratricopeptide (TPR) repeat protein